MSGGRPRGQLERSLVALTIGMHQGAKDRRNALASSHSGEYDQQIQLAVSGQATSTWVFTDTPVTWEHPFVYAPLQRDPPFLTPHVSTHIEFTSVPSDLVVANAHLIGWIQNAQNWFIGATVRVAVCAPLAPGTVSYAANVHLTFEGYACPTDEEYGT